MRVERHDVASMTVDEFADQHGLTMQVRERPTAIGAKDRYYASFSGVEVMGPGVLIGAYGDGATPEEAIQKYAAEIEFKRIAVNAYGPGRREILVPRLAAR